MKEISFEDWQKLDLRVATIKKVEDIENSDKLYKLTIDVGEEGERVVCAGIKNYYSKDELVGKQIIIIANLKPKKIRGIESQGMLLAAVNKDRSKIRLIEPDKEIESGSVVS